MNRVAANGEAEGIVARLRETADGLGQLIADHVKLARIELAAEARGYVRDLLGLVVGGAVLATGYALGCVAAAQAVGRLIGGPLAFLLVAAANLVVGALVTLAASRRIRRARVLPESVTEAARSVSTLAHPLAEPNGLGERTS